MTLDQAAEIRGLPISAPESSTSTRRWTPRSAPANSSLLLVADAVNFNSMSVPPALLSSLNASGVTLTRVSGNVRTTGAQVFANTLLAGPAGTHVHGFQCRLRRDRRPGHQYRDARRNDRSRALWRFDRAPAAWAAGLWPPFHRLRVSTVSGNIKTVGQTLFGGSLITTGIRTFNASSLVVSGTTTLGNTLNFNGVNARFAGAVDTAVSGLRAEHQQHRRDQV